MISRPTTRLARRAVGQITVGKQIIFFFVFFLRQYEAVSFPNRIVA